MKQELRTSGAPLPGGPYSQGIKVGNRVYVSGQRPVDPNTNMIPADFEEQAKLALKNVQAVLAEGGASLDDVVSVNVYLADISYFHTFNSIYATCFKPPFPTRTTVSCSLRDILVEVSAVAEL